MQKKIRKRIALVWAVLLFLSPLSEIRLYAVQAAETEIETGVESEADESDTRSEAEAGEIDTRSEVEVDEDLDEKSAERIAEKESESVLETISETTSEIEDSVKIAIVEEVLSESGFERNDETEVLDETEYPCPTALEEENVPFDENQEEFTKKLVGSKRARSTIPARYDARKEGYMPAIRDQGSWGACWSFSLTGAVEVSMIRDMGADVDYIDLSERHLAYFGFNTGYDALDNANDDTMTSPTGYYLDNGGNDIRGVIRLMNWNGGAKESDYPYSASTPLERTVAQDAGVYLENAYRYDFAEAILDENGAIDAEKKGEAIKVVKRMIMDYGAVSWSYYNDFNYLNIEDLKSYYNYVGGNGSAKTNHAIMAVGWDDNYAKENFAKDHQPENDGAWIIRNSWGEILGEDGYMYISYEDISLGSANPVYAVTACDTSKYDNNYFYGNTAYSAATIAVGGAAQVYTMKSEKAVREKLTAVSLLIGTSDVAYTLQIYKNPDMTDDGIVTNPASGIPMLDTPQTGTLGYAGFHTIMLDAPLVFDVDDNVSVVLTFPETKPNMYFDRSYTSDNGRQQGVHVITKGQSFFSSNLTSWTDNYGNNRTFRINALTIDCDDVEEVPVIKEISVTEAQDFNELPKVDLAWFKCSNVDGYRVYRAEDSGDYELIKTVGSSIRKYIDTLPKRNAGQYHYKIAAVYGSSEMTSKESGIEIKGTVEGSELTFSDYDSYTAVLAWDKTAGADGYELWGCFSGETDYSLIADFMADDTRSYIVSTDNWGEYRYKVRAKQGDVYTNWSEVCINRDLLWRQKSYYIAYYEWQPVKGAVSYKLVHKVNGKISSFKTNNTSVNISMKSSSYLPCDEHQYYVEAYDSADAGGNKISTSSTITFRMTPDAPTIDTAAYDYEHHITVTWSNVSDVDKIKLYRSENPSEQGALIADINADALSYADSVYKGKTYYYTLISAAINHQGECVEGEATCSAGIATFPEIAALDAAQYIEDVGVRLVWNAARGADGYLIERSDNDGSFLALAVVEDGTAQTYTDETVKKGNSYKYRIMSYFLAEDESQNPMPVQNERKVEIAPKPVMFSQITELKRESGDVQNGTARVSLSWDASENAQSYAIYRRVALEEGADSYTCIAQNLTQEQYIDSTARPDTTYSYKLIVTVNGLDSELEQTQDKTITTKPVLTALKLSVENVEILKGKETAFQITPSPAHYPYAKEIVWSACDEKGNELLVTQKNDTTVIKGKDGKEILSISEKQIHAVQDSETMRVTLTAAIDEIHAQCAVFVYSNNFWVRGKKDLTYTGAAVTQKLDVYDGKFLLTEGVDYTVAYKNNVKVSANETNKSKKPQVIVKGKGNYTGTQIIYFEILPEAAEDVNRISVLKAKVSSIKTLAYQGQALEPKPVIKYGKDTLAEGVDYTLSYENNNRAGTAVVLVNGINDYKGTKRVNFKINYNLQTDSGGLMSVKLDTVDVPYVKGGAKPIPEVRCGSRLLKEGTDYKLSYKNNRAIAGVSDQKAPTIIITGKGSYQGKKEVSFNIVPQDIGVLTLTAKDKVYTEKVGNFTTSFVIMDKDGKKLSAGKDYDKTSVKYTYADTGMPVMSTDTVPRGTTLRITVNAADSSAYSGMISGEYRIASYDIAKAKVTVEAQTYTGEPITPHADTGVAISYKGYGRELAEGVHYDITGYDNNVRKGTATLYIQGKGDFSGTKTVKFKIKTRTFKWWWE